QRILLLRGKILIEHGVLQAKMQQAVVWIDQAKTRQTGIQHLEIYCEEDITLENGQEVRSDSRAFLDVSTRGEIKLKAHNGKVVQQAQPTDAVYRRGVAARASAANSKAPGPIRQLSYQEAKPADPVKPLDRQAAPTGGI